jgi:acetoin utilization protein AcuB
LEAAAAAVIFNWHKERSMNIQEVMTRNIVTVELDDQLLLVKEIFDNSRFHHLIVIEEGKLFGVVSDRDLLKSISPNIDTMYASFKDMATLNKRVHQIMTRKPITLTPEASLNDAIKIFNQHRISCIPIVDEEFVPVGIVTWRDIMRHLEDKNL